jgi:tripartite-type tricarboxylate transporter receptor subunit TctC
MMMTGCKMTHIPYKGAGPALQDLIGGQVHVLFDNLPSSIGHIRGGRIRALGVTTSEPSSALPGVPTVAQTVPGYEASAWFGIGMPKGTPRDVVDKLNAEVNRALSDPAMVKKLEDLGGTPIKGSADDFGRVVQSEVDKWAKVVKASGATVE